MNAPARSVLDVREILAVLRRNTLLWIVPTIACGVLALGYSLVRPVKWKASQLLIVRDESSDVGQRTAGEFSSADALKTYQETVVQSARNFAVVEAALREVGPPGGDEDPAWPTRDQVAAAMGGITVGPPKGAEFGKTTAVVVTVEANTAERAERLNAALVARLDRRLQDIRAEKAKGFVGEYTQAVALRRPIWINPPKNSRRSKAGSVAT
ncbi:MAG: Wzz/FepE/Etk N-terminal domain-containing protein [Pirellulales bacterium]